jgi:hypothetical protein
MLLPPPYRLQVPANIAPKSLSTIMDFLLAKFTPQELEAMVSSLKSPHQQFGDILLQRRVSVTIGDYASSAQFGWGGDRACARCTSNLDTDLDTGGSGTTYARRNLKLLRALPFFLFLLSLREIYQQGGLSPIIFRVCVQLSLYLHTF